MYETIFIKKNDSIKYIFRFMRLISKFCLSDTLAANKKKYRRVDNFRAEHILFIMTSN